MSVCVCLCDVKTGATDADSHSSSPAVSQVSTANTQLPASSRSRDRFVILCPALVAVATSVHCCYVP